MRVAAYAFLGLMALAGLAAMAGAVVAAAGGVTLVTGHQNDGWAGVGGIAIIALALAVGVWGLLTLTFAGSSLVLARDHPERLLPLSLLTLVPTVLLIIAATPLALRQQRLAVKHDATLTRHATEMRERTSAMAACLAAPNDPATRVVVDARVPLADLEAKLRAAKKDRRLATARETACTFEALVPPQLRRSDQVILARAGDLDGDGVPDHLVAVTARSAGALGFALVQDDGRVSLVEPDQGRSRVLVGGTGTRIFDAEGPIAEAKGFPVDDPRFYPRTMIDDGHMETQISMQKPRIIFVAVPREVTALPGLPLGE